MVDNDAAFVGSIPEIYDAYLVPLIFQAFAVDLAQRTVALEPRAILETAAGSGIVTRALASRMAAETGYTVADLNQPMLDHARYKQGADGRLSWCQADALDLPFADAGFDAVVCQFAVMFFPDRIAGYAEARRVLKPGGSFLFNVWDHIEAHEIAEAVTDAAATVFPDDPPRFLPRTPHGYYDLDVIRDELTDAGFTHVAIATIDETSAAPSARHRRHRLLPGHAPARRDRGPRPRRPPPRHEPRHRIDRRPLRPRPHRRQDPRPRHHRLCLTPGLPTRPNARTTSPSAPFRPPSLKFLVWRLDS